MPKSDPTSRTTQISANNLQVLAVAVGAPTPTAEGIGELSISEFNGDNANHVDHGSMEPGVRSDEEYFAYDTRTNNIFKFRRMNKYVLIQMIPFGSFLKVSLEEFDEFFEGTPEPIPPFIVRVQ
jgi:hypothetical protein